MERNSVEYVNLHIAHNIFFSSLFFFHYLPLNQQIAKIYTVGKIASRKTKFGQETVSLYCGVLITLAILIIPKVIREEMVMGHHSKRNILRRWLMRGRLLKCQIQAWLEETSATLSVWKYKQLHLCFLLGVKDNFYSVVWSLYLSWGFSHYVKPLSFEMWGFASTSISTQAMKNNIKTSKKMLEEWNGKSIPMLIHTPWFEGLCQISVTCFKWQYKNWLLVEYNIGVRGLVLVDL